MTTSLRTLQLYGLLVAICALSFAFALSVGSVELSLPAIWHSLITSEPGLTQTLVLELRLPRALAAFATGGLLALAGALMQVLLRNPLADPYILGISGGSAAGALAVISLGISGMFVSAAAFGGALLSMVLVFSLAHAHGSWTPTRLLLTGIVIAAGWGALISFLLAIGSSTHLHGMLYWLMGDLSQAGDTRYALALLFVATVACIPFARSLNLLARGEIRAASLGVNVRQLRIGLYLLASMLTATAVTVAGNVGFVGLIVPHMLRLLIGSDHRWLLPAAVLVGGSLLVIADTLSRSVLAPTQLPVGVLTAFIGVPAFLWLLNKGR